MAKRRVTARKLKDKWRAKKWYKLIAPEMFEYREVGETPADDLEKVLGRVVEVTVSDLTGDIGKMYFKLKFQVWNVKDDRAYTKFIGHELTSDYVRRMVRRRRSKIEGIFDIKTRDGHIIRLKPVAVTDGRIQSSQKREIRKIMREVIEESVPKMTIGDLVRALINDDLTKKIREKAKVIHPLRSIDFRKSEVLLTPEDVLRVPAEKAKEGKESGEGLGAGGESVSSIEKVTNDERRTDTKESATAKAADAGGADEVESGSTDTNASTSADENG